MIVNEEGKQLVVVRDVLGNEVSAFVQDRTRDERDFREVTVREELRRQVWEQAVGTIEDGHEEVEIWYRGSHCFP